MPASLKDAEQPATTLGRLARVPASRYVTFFLLAIVGCAADLVTKELIFQWHGTDNPAEWWLIEGMAGIQTTVNQGALFGVGQGYSAWFATLSVIAATGIVVWLFYFGAAEDWLLTIALGCVMGGVFGNLYDRLGLWHGPDVAEHLQNGVRDWILLRYRNYTWPNFNIADALLVCGAALLMLHAFWHQDPSSKSAASGEPSRES